LIISGLLEVDHFNLAEPNLHDHQVTAVTCDIWSGMDVGSNGTVAQLCLTSTNEPVTLSERDMKHTLWRHLRNAFLVAGTTLTVVACSDEEGSSAPLTPPDLAACGGLAVSDTLELVSRLYATGVQIYRWNDTTWTFISPSATLFSDAEMKHTVGIHYSGPTWEGLDGSKVTAVKLGECTPDAGAIPWLLLGATAADLPGEFDGVTRIQRVNTTGGKAPANAGTVLGQVASVAYTTEYYFYAPQ
jgi:hypothetical protein